MYFMQQSNTHTKDEQKRLRDDLDKIRDTAFKKEDFKDFKEELWHRLDKFEADVKQQILSKER